MDDEPVQHEWRFAESRLSSNAHALFKECDFRNELAALCHHRRDGAKREDSDPDPSVIALDKLQHMILERRMTDRAFGFRIRKLGLNGR